VTDHGGAMASSSPYPPPDPPPEEGPVPPLPAPLSLTPDPREPEPEPSLPRRADGNLPGPPADGPCPRQPPSPGVEGPSGRGTTLRREIHGLNALLEDRERQRSLLASLAKRLDPAGTSRMMMLVPLGIVVLTLLLATIALHGDVGPSSPGARGPAFSGTPGNPPPAWGTTVRVTAPRTDAAHPHATVTVTERAVLPAGTHDLPLTAPTPVPLGTDGEPPLRPRITHLSAVVDGLPVTPARTREGLRLSLDRTRPHQVLLRYGIVGNSRLLQNAPTPRSMVAVPLLTARTALAAGLPVAVSFPDPTVIDLTCRPRSESLPAPACAAGVPGALTAQLPVDAAPIVLALTADGS
jgi:hypothetical protein